jgi:hypothetical protein
MLLERIWVLLGFVGFSLEPLGQILGSLGANYSGQPPESQ